MAAIVDSISSILSKIGERLIQEVASIYGVVDKVDWIKVELKYMQNFLLAGDPTGEVGVTEGAVNLTLVAAVQEAANEAEDAIEMFLLRAKCNQRRGIITRCTKVMSELVVLRDIIEKIGGVRTQIDELYRRRRAYGASSRPSITEWRTVEWGAFLARGEEVIGFEEAAEAVVKLLIEEGAYQRVASIVAMGGAGKTTLAHKIYADSRVKGHFHDCIVWACVSPDCNPERLLLDIANQVGMLEQNLQFLNLKVVQDKLSAFLEGKRYLIILDDVWNFNAWGRVRGAFPDVGNGSRILLTTRSMRVALDVGSHPYELPPLKQEDSWNLFLKKAFPRTPSDELLNESVEDIGREIVAKCNGLPLAVNKMGHVLSTIRPTMKLWKRALDNLNMHLSDCSEILALSYYDLPPHLKLCFLHLSLFPKEGIHVDKLKMIWVAEGFTQAGEEQSQDEVAKNYVQELISQNMIQVAKREWDETVVTCCIPDLLHAFATSKAEQHHLLRFSDAMGASISDSNTVRRLAVYYKIPDSQIYFLPKLRSLLCFDRYMGKFKDAKLLRVLDLEGVNVQENMMNVGIKELIYLKYLNLKNTNFIILPSSIGQHYNLDTLLLHDDTHLPQAIWEMEQLKHMCCFTDKFEGAPRFDCLRYLQTLCLTAGNWIQENNWSVLTELRKLYVKGQGHRMLDIGALWSSIDKLVKLQSLVLAEFSTEKSVLPSLAQNPCLYEITLMLCLERLPRVDEFPQNLTKLEIEESELEMDPMPVLGKLEVLENLRLGKNAYRGKSMRSIGFPRLRHLRLECLMHLEEWQVVRGAMPNLQSLCIEGCEKLHMLPEDLQDITSLRELQLPQSIIVCLCSAWRKIKYRIGERSGTFLVSIV